MPDLSSGSDPDAPLASANVDREAVRQWVECGESAIPELQAKLKDADPAQRLIARVALAQITGQWGWQDGVVWCRTVDEAVKKSAEQPLKLPDAPNPFVELERGKPVLALHLFGQFDEEFC